MTQAFLVEQLERQQTEQRVWMSGNVADDQTHQATWKLMAELVQRPDFVYVADRKLATTANRNEIARRGGRFITVLPATRKEDTDFRTTLREKPDTIPWREVYRLTNEDGSLRDLFRVCSYEHLSKEGYRLLWFHSQGKAESDAATRSRRMQKAIQDCTDLRERLQSARTRFRDRKKVETAVAAILEARGVSDWLQVASSHSLSGCSYADWVEVDSCRDEVAEVRAASYFADSLHSLRA